MKCGLRLEHGWAVLLLIGLGTLVLRAFLVANSVVSLHSDTSARSKNAFYSDLPMLVGNNNSLFSFWKNELNSIPNYVFYSTFDYDEHLLYNATLTKPMANKSGHETSSPTPNQKHMRAKRSSGKKNRRREEQSQRGKDGYLYNYKNSINNESRTEVSVNEEQMIKKEKRRKKRERELPPFVLEQYIQWHSVDALRADPNNRRYAIGHYACPVQAGNRINQFLNAFIWAIVTNRTLLWDYFDPGTCQHYLSTDPRFAQDANETNGCQFMKFEADCAKVLTRASWIPSYQDYKHILGEPHVLHYWSTSIPSPNIPEGYRVNIPSMASWKKVYAGVDKRFDNIPLVMFPIQPGHDIDLDTKLRRNILLTTSAAIRTAWQLYKYGRPFVYGMLFRATFDFRQPLAVQPAIQQKVTKDTFTIAIHSRHQLQSNNGGNIASELNCLDRIFNITNRTIWTQTQPCATFLMSDRELTLRKLSHYLTKQYNCSVYMVRSGKDKRMMARSFSSEHGDYAGAAFFLDLQLLSNARHAFIGGTRSSSTAMALSLVEYGRRMDMQHSGGGGDDESVSRLKNFQTCDLLVNAKQRRSTPWLNSTW